MVSVRELRGGLMTTLTQCQQQVLDMLIS
ncbi:LexA family transcriptional regulator, partial [Escherichia coli]|nr:LexA family transcriptional regulator [Escherichia coli]EGD4894142.1 LexA family transcriptional regulator [Shigella boydii]